MNSMGSAVAATIGELKKRSNIADLLSPPDEVHDNFLTTMAINGPRAKSNMGRLSTQQPDAPPSPPISPYGQSSAKMAGSPPQCHTTPVRDPILYPPSSAQSVSARQPPLFNTEEKQWISARSPTANIAKNHEAIIDEHILRRSRQSSSDGSLPSREEYMVVAEFTTTVWSQYAANPQDWLKQERALHAVDRDARRQRHKLPSIRPAEPISKDNRTHATSTKVNSGRVQKPAQPKVPRTPKEKPVKPRPIRANGGRAVSTTEVGATAEPRARTVAASREDRDYLSIPDYCPPLDSLQDRRPNSLKVDWKAANPLDLSNDPLRDQLHPDELSLASGLRLDCATYLTSKRRIFQSRLQCARRGKEFRKTDAQQACKIDVNKASKLWMAYDNVGWLDLKYMAKYLN